ncbi:MAG: phosphatidylserine decarboxylase [Lachnospiraceae bacterium]|nr:phosphatidylserine decarboxylase [Lachnospiraceae bacterium]
MELLRFLYHTMPGRLILKPLTAPIVSNISGRLLDHPLSKVFIPAFIRKYNIDMKEFEDISYESFNEFFCRRIRPEFRPIERDPLTLISPCDGFLSVYPISNDLVVPVKGCEYSISSLLRSPSIAKRYEGGLCMVFRLCVNNYHRYCFPDGGKVSSLRHIPGLFHTVRPVALEAFPVFTENSREYCLLKTESFGTLLLMEVGAMLVGRICNHKVEGEVLRGAEKGYFQYGGSTVIVLVQKDRLRLFDSFKDALEEPVLMGVGLGRAIKEN